MSQSLDFKDPTVINDVGGNQTSGELRFGISTTGDVRIAGPSTSRTIVVSKSDGDQFLGDGITDGKIVIGNGLTTGKIFFGTDGAAGSNDGEVTSTPVFDFRNGIRFQDQSEVLDHFEIDTATPTLGDSATNDMTLSTALLRYTRIGNMVFFCVRIVISNLAGPGVGVSMYIKGLPYDGAQAGETCIIVNANAIRNVGTQEMVYGVIETSNTRIKLEKMNMNTGVKTDLVPADFNLGTGGAIHITGSYRTSLT